MLGTSVTLPCSLLSLQLVFPRLIHVNLNPGGVTCRRVSEAQVSQSSQKVKSMINECVPLITGVHAYLYSINDVWLSNGSGLGLGPSLGHEWAWILIQALKAYWTRGLPFYQVFKSGLIRLLLDLSDVVLGRILSVLATLLLL